MGQINLNNFKVITDKLNTFFVDNKFMVASEIPTTGDFKVGDIIINNGPTNIDEPMWICVEAGNPGTWTVFNSGGGSTGGGKLTTARNRVVLDGESKSEVSIGVSGFNKASDVLMVFINSRFMTEGVDYEINADSTKIVAIGEVWNEELASEFEIEMIVFKMMGEEGVVSSVNEIVKLKNTVVVNEAVNEVEIGIDGFNEGDDLTVYRNSVYMIEGIDYEVQGNKIVSLKGAWNAEGGSDYKFTFEVLKSVAKVNPDAVVGMEHLTEDVKEAIEAAGNIDLSGKQDKTDNGLVTTDKTIVGAINELFQDVDNGKNLIATSIGNPLITGNSTFSAMSEAILGLRRESENETDAREVLYNMMIEDGYNEATSSMTVDELISLLDDSQIDINDVKQIACGNYHTFILKNDGSIWSCGFNANGQLGLGNENDISTFTQVTTNINNDVKQVACGYNHTIIIKNDGSVWSCGWNNYGQLGLGDKTNKTTFTKVTTNINKDVKQIVCGYDHTFILKNDGSVWACGDNSYGQLGLNNTTNKTTFTKVTTNINNDVKQIACGNYHTFILKNDGSVWSCGANGSGQLGLNSTIDKHTFNQVTTNTNNVKQIACGNYHTIILKNDGSIWSCGFNDYGQLGLGDKINKTTFTKVTTNVNNDVKQIACCNYHTFILKNDGSVWATGNNDNGQLGLGNNTDKTTFTKVTTNITISEYEINRLKLYYYLLDNSIPVTESMDIGTMLDLLVDDYINNLILGYENNLRIILTDEGVELTGNETLADLIVKTDEEFTRQVVPAGDAVAANVLSGKTFINNTGQTVTGTMANNGAKTFTPSASQQTAPAGYYSGITCNAIAGLSAVNIVKGVTVGGVTGTASVAKAKANAGTAIQLWTQGFSFTGLQSPQTYTSSIIPVDGQYTFNLRVSNDGYGAAIIIKTNTGRVLLNTSVYQPDDDPRSFLYEFTLYSGETLVLTPSTSGGSSYKFQGSFTLSCGSFSAI